MKNSAYWANRMRILENSLNKKSYEYVKNLEEQYNTAIAEIDRKIAAWYQRFADNNGLTLSEAKKLLNSEELKEFRWTVADYIRHGQENGLSANWTKELENVSSRVHISRLDSLKLQLRQEAEALHGGQLNGTESLLSDIYREGYTHTAFEIQKGLGFGQSLTGINSNALKKVLSRPWTADGQTFRDRVWTNKNALVNSVNTQITQMLMRGEAPDKAIKAITHQFQVSKSKAGRLVMTESAAFSSFAQKDCFEELGVEKYEIIESLDNETCELCGALDGKVFKMSEYQVGATAPPFHPWCRGCTAPYFEDMKDIGARAVRDDESKEYTVPADMNYQTWDAYNQAVHAEPAITAAMRQVEAAVDGNLTGLDFRLKTPESYTRKINTDAKDLLATKSYEEAYAYATSHTYDAVRYTILSEANEFTETFSKSVYELQKMGYNISRVKNTLPNINAPYRGVNTVITAPNGYRFELQFHTPESLDAKNKTHLLYEESRKDSTSLERRIELDKQMKQITKSIKTPKGAETISPFDNLKGK